MVFTRTKQNCELRTLRVSIPKAEISDEEKVVRTHEQILRRITGIAVPLGLLVSPDLMRYQRMVEFTHNWLGKLIVFAIIVLFLWHAALRIFHMLHDFGVHAGTGAKLVCFGFPLLCTLATAYWVLAIGV